MIRLNWKAAYRTALWSHVQCLAVKPVAHRIAPWENVPLCFDFALFKTAHTLKGEGTNPPTTLHGLWLQLTSAERAWIPSLVAVCHPEGSQECISEKPRDRNHTREYLEPVSPGFLSPDLLSGTHWQATDSRVMIRWSPPPESVTVPLPSPPTSLPQVLPGEGPSPGPPWAWLFRAQTPAHTLATPHSGRRLWCMSMDCGSPYISPEVRTAVTAIVTVVITTALTECLLCVTHGVKCCTAGFHAPLGSRCNSFYRWWEWNRHRS